MSSLENMAFDAMDEMVAAFSTVASVRSGHPLPANSEDFDRAARTFRNLATVFTGLAESAEAHVRLATVSDASLLITPPTMSQELPATCDRSCPSPSSPSVNNSFNSDSSGTYETIIQREATAPGMAPGTHFLAPGMNSDDDPVVINYLMSDNIPPEKQWFVVVRGKTPGVYQNRAVVDALIENWPNSSFRRHPTERAAQIDYMLSFDLGAVSSDPQFN